MDIPVWERLIPLIEALSEVLDARSSLMACYL
jgi:hypothetical protein